MTRLGTVSHDPEECRKVLLQTTGPLVIDTETTGLVVWVNNVLSIGIRPLKTQKNYILFTPWCSHITIAPHRLDLATIQWALEPLARRDLTIIGQNVAFDIVMLHRLDVRVRGQVHDTEQMLRLLDQDRGRSKDGKHPARLDIRGGKIIPLNYRLKDVCPHLLGLQPIRTPDKLMDHVPHRQHVSYLCSDLVATELLYRHLWAQLTKRQRAWTCHQSSTLTKALANMTTTGWRVDVEFIVNEMARLEEQMEAVDDEHQARHGFPAVLTPKELSTVLFNRYRLPSFKRGVDQAHREILRKYANLRGWPRIADSITLLDGWQRLKSLNSRLGSFLKESDHYHQTMHSSFGVRQTSGRISSSNPNTQQMAKKRVILAKTPFETAITTRDLATARPGHILIAADIDQADARALANDIDNCRVDTETFKQQLLARRYRQLAGILQQYLPYLRACKNPDYNKPAPEPPPPFDPQGQHPLVDDFVHPTGDLYAQVASRVTGQTITKNSPTRDLWKVIFLSLVNGQAAGGIADKLGITVDKAKEYIAEFQGAYPDVIAVLSLRGVELALSGKVHTWTGRYRRVTPIHWCLTEPRVRILQTFKSKEKYWFDVVPLRSSMRNLTCFIKRIWATKDYKTRWLIYTHDRGRIGDKFYPRIDDRELVYFLPIRNLQWSNVRRIQKLDHKARPMEEARFNGMDAARRSAVNVIMQGSTADVLTSMVIRCQPVLHRHKAQMLACIHDELVFETPASKYREFITELWKVLEATPGPGFTIPMSVGIKVGRRFGRMNAVKRGPI